MTYPSQFGPIPESDLQNWNTDRSVDPPTMVRGMMYKSSAGAWEYWDGSISGITVSGMSLTAAPLSADSSAVSAKQQDATNLRISAFSNDAALMRVSAVGVTITGAISANQQLSARMLEGTAFIGSVSSTVTMAASQSLSARNLEGTAYIGSVSANQAGTWALSALIKEGTAFIGQVSAAGGQLSATMKEGTAFIGQVSAILKDNPVNATYLGRVSVVNASATGEGTAFIGQVSAILKDNATTATYLGRVSAVQGDAANQNVSAKSNDSGTFRTSSYIPVDTVGQLTSFRSLSLSASQAVKATAGALHGYYLWNTTTVPQYVKFTNTSGAINVGTDTPVFMAMLPASAAANIWFGQGLKGFTAGIGVHASSAVADNATTPAAASAVGGTIFYN